MATPAAQLTIPEQVQRELAPLSERYAFRQLVEGLLRLYGWERDLVWRGYWTHPQLVSLGPVTASAAVQHHATHLAALRVVEPGTVAD